MAEDPSAVAAVDGKDFSAGSLSQPDQSAINMGLDEYRHRTGSQKTVVASALAIVVVLVLAAILFGCVMAYQIAVGNGEKIHWHASILVAAFVVPATIIVVALLRAVYNAKEAKDGDTGPALAFLKEVLAAIKQVFPKLGA